MAVSCGAATNSLVVKDHASDQSVKGELPSAPGDKYSIVNYTSNVPDRYMKYLVNVDDYTTDGSYFHKKHVDYLIGLAEVLTEKENILLKERSLGFYYDRLSKSKSRLYLGLDFACKQSKIPAKASYYDAGRAMMQEYIARTLSTVRLCEKILQEKSVEGVVVGLYWFRSGTSEYVTVWINKENVEEYFSNNLTFKELIIKSTVTNTDGRKIRLTL